MTETKDAPLATPPVVPPAGPAAPSAPPANPGRPPEGAEYWQAEAKRAFQARDAAKQEAAVQAARLAETDTARARAEAEARRAAEEGDRALRANEERARAEVAGLRRKAADKLIPAALRGAIAAVPNVAPAAVADLTEILRARVGIDPETFELFVHDAAGAKLLDDRMLPVSVEQFVRDEVNRRDYARLDTMVAGSGLQPGERKAAAARFNCDAALADPRLNAEWKRDDLEGHTRAFAAYYGGDAVDRARRKMKKA